MLLDNLYKTDSFIAEDGKLSATVRININHKIFEGHFPGQPVLPGVCQIQLVKELLEKALEKELFLSEASQCKFLMMVNPRETQKLEVTIDYKPVEQKIAANAVIRNQESVFLKLTGGFDF